MQKIIGIGNCLVDVLAPIESDEALATLGLPKGSMQLIGEGQLEAVQRYISAIPHSRTTGGSSANTIKALAHLGIQTGFIGKIGQDEPGTFFRSQQQATGIHSALITEPTGATGTAYTFISPDGQRTFATYLGVASTLRDTDFSTAQFSGYDLLYIEGYLVQNHPMIEQAMRLAKAQGLQVCLDLASYNIVEADRDFFRHLLTNYVDIVFANEEESHAFTGLEPQAALRALGELCPIAIVKLGAQGATVMAHGESHACPAELVNHVKDTTAAGDYFAAGFLYGLLHQRPFSECLQIGSRLSGEVIQVVGTTLSEQQWNHLRSTL